MDIIVGSIVKNKCTGILYSIKNIEILNIDTLLIIHINVHDHWYTEKSFLNIFEVYNK